MAIVPRSEFSDVVFPAAVSAGRANTLAVVSQLLLSQWWSADELRHWQLRQAEQLIRHAIALPHVRDAAETAGWSPDTPLTDSHWARWPVLDREHARGLGEQLFLTPPQTHGRVAPDSTSGSTGTPLKIQKTELFQFFYEAAGLREMHWSARDPGRPTR